jgi:hypothetical protein
VLDDFAARPDAFPNENQDEVVDVETKQWSRLSFCSLWPTNAVVDVFWWKSGVVVQHWYKPNAVAVRELDLNPRARFPYQIQLDGKNGEEGLIFAPEDVDDCIRRPKTTKAEPRPLLRFNINDLVLVLVRKGVWSSGKSSSTGV